VLEVGLVIVAYLEVLVIGFLLCKFKDIAYNYMIKNVPLT